MKILLYTYDIVKIGGIETSFYEFAQYLKEQGYDVGVRYSHIDSMQLKRYRDAGIDARAVKPELCDVLIVGSIWRQPERIVAKLVIQQVHADWTDGFWKGASSAIRMIQKASGRADLFTCVSKSSSDFVSRHTTKPVIVMNNLAPKPTMIAKVKHEKFVFAAFTRMTAEKGLKNYQDLRRRIESFGIDAEFRIYTNGKNPEGWTLHEPIPDIRTELPSIDFVCSMADTESFGYTIAEANSCGVPCIIKRTNSTGEFFGAPNIILDTANGLGESDLRSYKMAYTLRDSTEKSIQTALATISSMLDDKVILKCMIAFNDIEAKKRRILGETFSVGSERATQLLSHQLKIVEAV